MLKSVPGPSQINVKINRARRPNESFRYCGIKAKTIQLKPFVDTTSSEKLSIAIEIKLRKYDKKICGSYR